MKYGLLFNAVQTLTQMKRAFHVSFQFVYCLFLFYFIKSEVSAEKTISCAYLMEFASYKLSYMAICLSYASPFAWDLHACDRCSIKLTHKGSMGNTVKIMLHTMFLTMVYLTCFYLLLFRSTTYITFWFTIYNLSP